MLFAHPQAAPITGDIHLAIGCYGDSGKLLVARKVAPVPFCAVVTPYVPFSAHSIKIVLVWAVHIVKAPVAWASFIARLVEPIHQRLPLFNVDSFMYFSDHAQRISPAINTNEAVAKKTDFIVGAGFDSLHLISATSFGKNLPLTIPIQ